MGSDKDDSQVDRSVSHRTFVDGAGAAAQVTVPPGGMREMHWHPNADERQYDIEGVGEMTLFQTGPKTVTTDFHPGEIGYVWKNLGRDIKNIGNKGVVSWKFSVAPEYRDISLADWLAHTPPQMVSAHLNVTREMLDRFRRRDADVVPL